MLLLGWRAVHEDLGLASSPYVVRFTRKVAADTVEIALMPLADPIHATPGQFILVAFRGGRGLRGCGEFHPFTVCGLEADGLLRIAVKALGDCTRWLQSVEPGVVAHVQGAFGTLFEEKSGTPELWVAGGMGITPFLALLRARHVTAPTMLLYLYRTSDHAAFLPELQALAANDPKVSLCAVATGNNLPDLRTVLPDSDAPAGREIYVPGPPRLIDSVRRALRDRGIAARRIHTENVLAL